MGYVGLWKTVLEDTGAAKGAAEYIPAALSRAEIHCCISIVSLEGEGEGHQVSRSCQ